MKLEDLKQICRSMEAQDWDPDYMPMPAARFAATFNPELVGKLLKVVEAASFAAYVSGPDPILDLQAALTEAGLGLNGSGK